MGLFIHKPLPHRPFKNDFTSAGRSSTHNRMQQLASNSPQARHAAALQRRADASPRASELHRLQRKAGGNAPIQRRMYKNSELRNMIKRAVKDGAGNRTAILLSIYNEMRFVLDPTPGAFAQVNAGRDAMIAAHQLDAEDAEFLYAEATRMQQAGGDQAQALRLRVEAAIAAKRDGIEAKYGHHIFEGDFKEGTPTGFHSKADGSGTHEAYGAATGVGNVGAYQQSVRSQANNAEKKPIQSTFFPDAATHDDVVDAITVVYGYGLSRVAYVDASVNGMKLEKRGATVFPAGGDNNRQAE